MDELEAIQASLASFTKRLEEVSTDRFNELRKCSFFDAIPSEWLTSISDQTEIRTFAVGEKITAENDSMNSFYVILFGSTTALYKQKMVGKIRSGECIGEAMFFGKENLVRSATVVADGQVIVAEIKKSGIERFQSNTMVYMHRALLLALFAKLQAANRTIAELMR